MNTEANEILMQMGSMLLTDPKYQRREWKALSVVGVVVLGSVDITGFTYDNTGEATPGTPSDDNFIDLLKNFQAATKVDDKPVWKSVLIQIKKPDLEIKVQFEYENALRWKISPGNIDKMKIALMPE
jgi:hypothetical protein